MKLALAGLIILALIAGAACNQAPETPPETSSPLTTPETQAPTTTPPPATTTPAEEETETPPPATIAEEDIEAARQVVFAYFEAFNNYNVDGVLALLEESWRQEREESITSEINQMKMFGVTLGVEEEAEPSTEDEMVAIKIKIATPLGDNHYIYYLTEIEGEWKIYYAEEV